MKKKFIVEKTLILEDLGVELEPGDQITIEDGKELAKRDITELIVSFLSENSSIDDSLINEFCEENGINENEFKEEIYKILSAFFAGGKSYDKQYTESDADPEQLAMGIEVELEHVNAGSSYAKLISKKITLDHLAEAIDWKDPRYYTMLHNGEVEYSEGKIEQNSETPKKENIYTSRTHRVNGKLTEAKKNEPIVKQAFMNPELKKLR
jgi:hypothetical protein